MFGKFAFEIMAPRYLNEKRRSLYFEKKRKEFKIRISTGKNINSLKS